MTNRFPGKCIECKTPVPAHEGVCKRSKKGRFYVLCADHSGHTKTSVTRMGLTAKNPGLIILGDGTELYQNPAGRCMDAPCCGCCTC